MSSSGGPRHSSSVGHRSSAGSGSASVEVEHLPARWSPAPPTPSLPIGVVILAFLIALAGLAILLAGALFLLNVFLGPSVVPSNLLIVSNVDQLGAAILIVLGAVLLSVATALWHQET